MYAIPNVEMADLRRLGCRQNGSRADTPLTGRSGFLNRGLAFCYKESIAASFATCRLGNIDWGNRLP